MKILNERKRQIFLSLLIIFIIIIFDRLTKYIAVKYLKGNDPISFLKNIFVLIYAENSGAFLSLGSNLNIYIKYVIIFIIPTIIYIFGLLYLMIIEKKYYRIIIFSFIIGGGIGNSIDRLLINNFIVIDFMNFGIGNIRTGILNLADLSVTFGVIIWIIMEIKQIHIIGNEQRVKHEK